MKLFKTLPLLLLGLYVHHRLNRNKIDINKLNCLVDLHCHLDGSISVANARQLAELSGIEIPDNDEDIRKMLIAGEDCRDLKEFLEKFPFPISLLQTKETLKLATKNLLTELKEDGIMYAEIRFAPAGHMTKGLSQEEIIEAVLEGINEAPIPAGLTICAMRSFTKEQNYESMLAGSKYLDKGVVAYDIAGVDLKEPDYSYKELIKAAKEKGYRITIHAGESEGPDSVLEAISWGADRIGHGVRSIEDSSVVGLLASKKIPLECCPTSNLITKAFSSIEEYPIKKLMEAGCIVTINTDDMAVCGTDIKNEWNKIIRTFRLKDDEIRQLLVNGIDIAYAKDEVKLELYKKLYEETTFNE